MNNDAIGVQLILLVVLSGGGRPVPAGSGNHVPIYRIDVIQEKYRCNSLHTKF